MKKTIIFLIFIIFFTGCTKNNSTNEIKPTSIYNPTPDDASEFLKQSQNIGTITSENKDNKAIPFECKEIEYEVFVAINKIRKENNLNELEWDSDMYTHILTRTDEITKNFSHTRPNGKSCFTVYDKLHGENIAKGYSTADAVVKGWMDSKGHRENILGKNFKRTSIGYIKKDSGTFWCQGFGY